MQEKQKKVGYLLTNGARIHAHCKKSYQKEHDVPNRYPGVASVYFKGYTFDEDSLCYYCHKPMQVPS